MCHNSTNSNVYIPQQYDDTEIAHFGVTNLKIWLTNCQANDYLQKIKITLKYNKSYIMNLGH